MTPQVYVGNIMDLCQDRRGEFKDMVYQGDDRVELHYHLPLNEIIYDFFDALKSRTKGYASLDYTLESYRPSDLVKLDILLNGDMVDALSFIVHRDKAYPRARRICEKLKDNIPLPMMFDRGILKTAPRILMRMVLAVRMAAPSTKPCFFR